MHVSAGTRLGPYEIVSPLGAGGMGEVWKATDTRLDRSVAIKILPADFAGDAKLRVRFEREARTISQLEHAHICRLYDIGDGYLVMELLNGESLADRIARGPLPPGEVLRYGAQIAEALDRAHRAGVVHRDLKPANVMITKSGAKLLDFGLAKSTTMDVALDGATVQRPLTQEGMIVGTFQYMAPEQLEGSEADARTDAFAFGTVLYEMLTGKRAFEGKTRTSLIAAIVDRDPVPVSQVQPLTPPSLEHIIVKCLEKDPDARWQSMHDVAEELKWIAGGGGHAAVEKPRRRAWVAALAAGALAAGMAIGWLVAGRRPAGALTQETSRTGRFSIVLPPEAPLVPPSATPFAYLRPSLAISPDKSRIAYAAIRGRSTQIWIRRFDRAEPTPVPDTEGGFDPFFSPDGEWLGFFTYDSLMKVPLRGGPPLKIAAAVNPVGGTWCDDGSIFFSANEGGSLWRVRGDNAPVRINVESRSTNPQCLTGSSGLLLTIPPANAFTKNRPSAWWYPVSADYADVGVLPLPVSDATPRTLVARGYAPQYSPSGHLVFVRGGSLVAAPFDAKALRLTGPEVVVQKGVRVSSVGSSAAQYALARDGSLLYAPGPDYGRTQLAWVDRQGNITRTAIAPNAFGNFHLSADGRRVATEVGGIQNDVFVYDLASGRGIRMTSDGRPGRRPVWHPDGRSVAFHHDGPDRWYLARIDSNAGPQPLNLAAGAYLTSWIANDVVSGLLTNERIWVGTLQRPQPITSSGREWGARLAPDGRFVAYTSSRSGTYQVFVQPLPPTGEEWQVSSDFGEEPVWSSNSRELFYRRHDEWWSVPFEGGRPAAPRLLFSGPFLNPFGPSYDVAPDGRFLVALPQGAGETVRELAWVEGWGAELRRAVSPR